MLTQAVFPVSWNTISSYNDTLFVAVSNSYLTPGGNPVWYQIATVNIPHGVYDVDSMCQTLQQELTSILSSAVPGLTFTIQSTTDGRISISVGDPEVTNAFYIHILSKDDIALNNWWQDDSAPFALPPNALQLKDQLANGTLGFYGSGLQTPGPGEALIASGLFNSLGTNCIYLHSNMQQFSSVGPSAGDSDVIAVIPVFGGFGTLNVYQCSGTDIDVFSVANMTLQTLSFRLTNDHGQRVDLRNGNCVLSFKIYDRP
jgi:hypothetical protein